jgi:SPP1 family predicted phage head-tail adaptor
MTTSGALRARVTLLRPETTEDDIGGVTKQFVSAGDVWAEVDSDGAAGGEDYEDASARASYRLAIRMRRDVRPGWRVALGDRAFAVRAIADADRFGAILHLFCEEEFL